jgi:chemotaxis protein CheD
MTETRVVVRIGEARTARPGTVLCTVGLGSCVAILLWDPEARLAGLAHAMLPAPANGRPAQPEARFASLAVGVLVRLLAAEGAAPDRLRARLAGGACMFEALLPEAGRRLGLRNVQAARDALRAAGIPIDGEEVGGSYGRSVYLRAADGVVTVTSVSQPDVLL